MNMKAKKACIAVVGCGYWGKNIVRNVKKIPNTANIITTSSDKTTKIHNYLTGELI